METIGTLSPGQMVTHEEIEAAIGTSREQSRYRTVTAAWRNRMLREFNVDISAVPGEGFRALTADERVSESIKGFARGAIGIGRSARRAVMAPRDEMTPAAAARADHAVRVMHATLEDLNRKRKELASPPKPPEVLRGPGND